MTVGCLCVGSIGSLSSHFYTVLWMNAVNYYESISLLCQESSNLPGLPIAKRRKRSNHFWKKVLKTVARGS